MTGLKFDWSKVTKGILQIPQSTKVPNLLSRYLILKYQQQQTMLNFKRKKTINQNHKKQAVPGTMWVILINFVHCRWQLYNLKNIRGPHWTTVHCGQYVIFSAYKLGCCWYDVGNFWPADMKKKNRRNCCIITQSSWHLLTPKWQEGEAIFHKKNAEKARNQNMYVETCCARSFHQYISGFFSFLIKKKK